MVWKQGNARLAESQACSRIRIRSSKIQPKVQSGGRLHRGTDTTSMGYECVLAAPAWRSVRLIVFRVRLRDDVSGMASLSLTSFWFVCCQGITDKEQARGYYTRSCVASFGMVSVQRTCDRHRLSVPSLLMKCRRICGSCEREYVHDDCARLVHCSGPSCLFRHSLSDSLIQLILTMCS